MRANHTNNDIHIREKMNAVVVFSSGIPELLQRLVDRPYSNMFIRHHRDGVIIGIWKKAAHQYIIQTSTGTTRFIRFHRDPPQPHPVFETPSGINNAQSVVISSTRTLRWERGIIWSMESHSSLATATTIGRSGLYPAVAQGRGLCMTRRQWKSFAVSVRRVTYLSPHRGPLPV